MGQLQRVEHRIKFRHLETTHRFAAVAGHRRARAGLHFLRTLNGHKQSHEIIAGTGESNFAQDNVYGAGVLRSLDGGATWSQDQTFTQAASQGPGASGPYIGAIAVQPNQQNPVLLAAVQGTDYAAGGELHSGVWRSLDGGVTWARSQPRASSADGAPFNPATDVLFDPSDPSGNTAYAVLGDPLGDSNAAASCSSKPCNGLYVSPDAGGDVESGYRARHHRRF